MLSANTLQEVLMSFETSWMTCDRHQAEPGWYVCVRLLLCVPAC
jgi:hypothetical protein